jgi:receptor protein-tyrosine kinase
MVASAVADEGKSFTAVNLSLSMAAETDCMVVLVDGDCIRARLTELFGVRGALGLTDLLQDPKLALENVVIPTNVPNLSFLPAGRRLERAVELLASARMRNLCAALSQTPQRLIVFDSSPLLLTAEAPALASQVGQIVVVVRADRTPQQAVLAAIGKLDLAKPVGLILNQATAGLSSLSYDSYGVYAQDYYDRVDARAAPTSSGAT